MSKPYLKLRARLTEDEIDQAYLAEILGRGITYVSKRMTAKEPWSQDDMYKMMDEFDIPYNQMHIYFPNYHNKGRRGRGCDGKPLRTIRVG